MSASSPTSTSKIQPNQIPHDFLIAEYNYIAQSTIQSSEDRARVSNYYLVTIGAAIAAIFSDKLFGTASPQPAMYLAIGIGLIALGLIGLFTVLSLVRLRAGWLDGALAMNQIKDYYKCVYSNAKLTDVILWDETPNAAKMDSVAFWTALTVILMDSLVFGLGIAFVGAVWSIYPSLGWSPVIGGSSAVLVCIGQIFLYRGLLARADKQLKNPKHPKRNWQKDCPGVSQNASNP